MEAFRTPRKTTLGHCPTNPFLICLPRQCQKWWVVCTWSPNHSCLALGLSAVLMSLAKLHKRPKDFCFYVDVYGGWWCWEHPALNTASPIHCQSGLPKAEPPELGSLTSIIWHIDCVAFPRSTAGIRIIQPTAGKNSYLKHSLKTKSTRDREIWYQQSPVNLLQQDLDILSKSKHKIIWI